ncbi:Methyl-CpG DNA binding,DNA-binding domain [Cinara cedri]|uniref:Methyl-CpG DNA binding,DNA-binding domain n=1 Tax=Cinara cedri TaxID=506608 RepID=A0A5E4MYU3_9HEMI|nr:Methyl-CpG DNA binding,DNA-binding domain [Cinara cedri]
MANMINSGTRPALPDQPRDRRRKKIDATSYLYKVPFAFGWNREIVLRNTYPRKKKKGDVYYYSPENVKFRSIKEIFRALPENGILKTKHFLMAPIPTEVNDYRTEFIRKAGTKPKEYMEFNNKRTRNLATEEEAAVNGMGVKEENIAPSTSQLCCHCNNYHN